MSRGPLTFRQSDVTRAIRAARAAGVEVARVEIDKDGKISVFAGEPVPRVGSRQENEVEQWLGKHHAR
jgi:hypothetical protein